MPAQEHPRGPAHGGQVEGTRHVPMGVERERVLHEPVPDQVAVGFSARIETGMERGRDEAAFHDANIARQIRVERALQDRRGVEARRVEGGDLPERVDACVGAARALQADLLAPKFFQRDLDAFLHRALGGLPLPAGKIGAAIGNRQLVPLQRRIEAMRPALAQFP